MVDERLIAEGELACSVAGVCVLATQGDNNRLGVAFWAYVGCAQQYDKTFPGIKESFDKGIKQGVAGCVLKAIDAPKEYLL